MIAMANYHNKNRNQNHREHEHHEHDHHNHSEHEGGHAGHHEHMIKDFKKRFWISLVLALPITYLSPMIQTIFNYEVTFTGNMVLLFVLSTIVFFYGGKPFLLGAWDEIKEKQRSEERRVGKECRTGW